MTAETSSRRALEHLQTLVFSFSIRTGQAGEGCGLKWACSCFHRRERNDLQHINKNYSSAKKPEKPSVGMIVNTDRMP